MSKASRALAAYEKSGGLAFYLLGNGSSMIGVRDGSVSVLSNYQEDARLGALAGSRAELVAGRRYPVAVITFADGARYVSRELVVGVRGAEKEVAAYNKLAGYVPGPRGYIPPDDSRPGAAWSCRFCGTRNTDGPVCGHCGAPHRP